MNPVLKAAIESTEISEPVEPKEEALVVEEAVAGDETPLILEECVSEADKTASDGGLMLDALINLESIALKLESAGFENMTATGAQFADLAVRTALAPLNLDRPLIASCESFERRPAIATRLSMEALKDQAQSVLNTLKELLMKLWNMLKDFFKQMLNGNQFLRAQAEKLKTAAQAAKGSPSKQTLELTEKQTRYITDDQGLIQPNDLASLRDYVWYNKLAMSISDGAVAKGVAHLAETLDDFIVNGNKENVESYNQKFLSVPLPLPDIFNDKKNEDGTEVYYSPLMPGMVRFRLAKNPLVNDEKAASFFKVAAFANCRLTVVKSEDSVEANKAYPVLSLDQVAETCESVIKATKWIDELREHIDRSEQMINQRVDAVINHGNSKEYADRMIVLMVVKMISNCETLRAQIVMRTATELMSFVRTALQIATASVALYGNAEKALPSPQAA